jgi:hypothetical protein
MFDVKTQLNLQAISVNNVRNETNIKRNFPEFFDS